MIRLRKPKMIIQFCCKVVTCPKEEEKKSQLYDF